MLGHVKEIISVDIYGDTQEIIEDCLYVMESFMDDVIPESTDDLYYDFSDVEEMRYLSDEYLEAA